MHTKVRALAARVAPGRPGRRSPWAGRLAACLAGASLLATLAAAPAAAPAAASRRARCTGRTVPLTFVSPFGFDASAGILDVFAAEHLGYFAAQCLDVSIVTSSFTPVELVSAGRGTITGVGSAADALVAMAHGAAVTAIATFGDTSDYALLTRPGITNLRQLEGKTLAYHSTLPVIIEEMLRRAGVDLRRVDLVDDTSYDPSLLEAGRFQALQAYQSNEPLTLRARHEPFREWIPARFGVRGTFNVDVVNSAFLRRRRAAVGAFLRADLHAFDYCSRHAVACVGFEEQAAAAAGATFDRAHALAEWRFESRLAWRHTLPGAGVGVESYAEWRPEAEALRSFGLVAHVPLLRSVEDVRLAASLYRGTSLVWPG